MRHQVEGELLRIIVLVAAHCYIVRRNLRRFPFPFYAIAIKLIAKLAARVGEPRLEPTIELTWYTCTRSKGSRVLHEVNINLSSKKLTSESM